MSEVGIVREGLLRVCPPQSTSYLVTNGLTLDAPLKPFAIDLAPMTSTETWESSFTGLTSGNPIARAGAMCQSRLDHCFFCSVLCSTCFFLFSLLLLLSFFFFFLFLFLFFSINQLLILHPITHLIDLQEVSLDQVLSQVLRTQFWVRAVCPASLELTFCLRFWEIFYFERYSDGRSAKVRSEHSSSPLSLAPSILGHSWDGVAYNWTSAGTAKSSWPRFEIGW